MDRFHDFPGLEMKFLNSMTFQVFHDEPCLTKRILLFFQTIRSAKLQPSDLVFKGFPGLGAGCMFLHRVPIGLLIVFHHYSETTARTKWQQETGYCLLRLVRHLPTMWNIQTVSRLHSYIVILHINKTGVLHKVNPEEKNRTAARLF